eukprot:TRINITY_DN33075_c0_g1_i1.p1 TRINITY_DN33075_c0_g1~~TRINITY_DN33075_c0_g1_i1.p1  ORF type:complete len:612 (+),score=87.09 TRINITY_DN33075_c0_g1_i1:69-1838(+)
MDVECCPKPNETLPAEEVLTSASSNNSCGILPLPFSHAALVEEASKSGSPCAKERMHAIGIPSGPLSHAAVAAYFATSPCSAGISDCSESVGTAGMESIARLDSLRSVRLSWLLLVTTLQGWSVWRRGPLGMTPQGRARLWALSEPTQAIDIFLSHAWRSPGTMKYAQLLLHMGLPHAAAAIFLVLLAIATLTIFGVLPASDDYATYILHWRGVVKLNMWCTVLAPAAGLLILLLSPFLPQRRSCNPRVFLDVACICQDNEDLKAAGIRALGEVLTHSRELHVLWSPSYFSRLWCVYELALYLHEHQRQQIHFRPLYAEVALLAYFVIAWFVAVFFMSWLLYNPFKKSTPLLLLSYIIAYCPFLCLMHILRRLMWDKHQLATQMKNFDVGAASCCDNQDRTLILESITARYGSAEAFNMEVRGPIRKKFLDAIQGNPMSFWTAWLCATPPVLCKMADLTLGFATAGLPDPCLTTWAIHVATLGVSLEAAWAKLLFYLAEKFCRRGKNQFLDVLSTVALYVCWAGPKCIVNIALIKSYKAHLHAGLCGFALAVLASWFVFTRLKEPKLCCDQEEQDSGDGEKKSSSACEC